MKMSRREAARVAAAGIASLAGASHVKQLATAGTVETPKPAQKTPRLLRGHEGAVYAMAFSGDGKTLASVGGDGTARLWDVATAKESCVLYDKDSDRVFAVAFSPDRMTLVSGTARGVIRLWDLGASKVRASLEVPGPPNLWGKVSSVAFTADGKKLVTACGLMKNSWGTGPAAVMLWDLSTGNTLWKIDGGHTWSPSVALIPPDEKTFASAGGDGITIHDVTTGKRCAKLVAPHGGMTHLLAVSPDGKTLASVELGRTTQPVEVPYCQIVLWNVATGEIVAKFEAQTDHVTSLAFAPDGKVLASAELGGWRGTVKLWEVAWSGWSRAFYADNARCVSVAFSPDGKVLAAGCDNGIVELWA